MRKVIIAAGGEGSRWNNHMGIKKHMIKIDGTPILERTKSQFEKLGDRPLSIMRGARKYGDLDKIYSSRKYWNDDGRTIIVFGDTYFTDEAITKIADYPNADFAVFGRIEPSEITGKPYGELFAVSFYENDIAKIERCIERVVNLHNRELVEAANLWALYRAMHRFPDDLMNHHYAGEGVITINDWTEDFDWPIDYDRYMERRQNEA